jgi:rhodanese-related sulfurtransferase
MPHATPDEYHAAVAAGFPVLLLDLRGASMVLEEGAIPGARAANHDNLPDAVADWPKTAPIMTLCACPEDAGAVQAARELQKQGYVSVRPIRGGWEAWKAHGFARDAGALGAEDAPVAGQHGEQRDIVGDIEEGNQVRPAVWYRILKKVQKRSRS